ncbi:MAG: glycosyl hydrolase 53 family protein [Lachnospiraceae bacterium]|nr:glycosyl hydrolase 53 family protein [Lachnospiraceae bacterium]
MIRHTYKTKIITYVTTALLCISLASGCGTSGQISDGEGGAEMQSEEIRETESAGIEQTYFPELPTEKANDGIYVTAIDGIADDFIRGMDISSLPVEEASGVKYYQRASKGGDDAGTEQDLLKILADAGINCIRVRVWNDPFDAEGNGYGGGNCTADTAAELGRRAAAYGMDLCVDFHYSDFWADPNKQMRPKAWNNMRVNDQKQALYDYTCESLRTILDAGARVTMVQIGNEINYGLSGRTAFKDIAELLKYGSQAVRDISSEYGRDMAVTVHYTGIDDSDGIYRIADRLDEYEIDYDVFGVSYYPYWHGGMDNLTAVLKKISADHNVKTCVMETSYMYTADDGDGSGNSVSDGNAVEGYPVSVQGQASCVRDVCAAASEAGAMGVFYWEGGWIPVNPGSGTREQDWEKYGSGWASSYAAEYDPDDAGKYYGGCSWENQAFFDFEGHELPSLSVFKYLKYGAAGFSNEVLQLESVEIDMMPGDELKLPGTVSAIWTDPDCTDKLTVKWDEDIIGSFDTDKTGSYTVPGRIELAGTGASGDLKFNEDGTLAVEAKVNIANKNLVADPSFEEEDHSCWKVESLAGTDPTDYQNKSSDAHSGSFAFHFWDKSAMEFTLEQTVKVEKAGKYRLDAFMQGGDFSDDSEIYIYAVNAAGKEYRSDPVIPDGWVNWKNPEITGLELADGESVKIGAYVRCNPESWATFDDFSLKME